MSVVKKNVFNEKMQKLWGSSKIEEENKQLKANSENNQTEYLKTIDCCDYELLAAKLATKQLTMMVTLTK